MRPRVFYSPIVAILAVLSIPPVQGDDPPPPRLTLEQSIAEALARSPSLRAKRASMEQAEGRLLTAKTYPFDPEIVLSGARRTAGGASETDRGVSLTQEIEIAGQRGLRVREASAEIESARAQFRRAERLLAAGVSAAFVLALQARDLLEVERANADLARSLADVARKRFEAGAAALMEGNLALAHVGRAERDRRLAQGRYDEARVVLAEMVGLDPAQPPEPIGALDPPTFQPPALAGLVAGALDRRLDLQAFRSGTEASRLRIDRIRREAFPNVVVGAVYAEEGGTDRIVGGEIGIRIPLFNRNQGLIAEAQASQRQALAETDALELQVRKEVASALVRYRAAADAATTLQQQILGTLNENLNLLQRSFEAGKTSWTEVLIFRREFVDAQRDYVVTVADARLAALELDLAQDATAIQAPTQESEP